MADPQGTPIWFEHASADPARAQAFYEAVAGWTVGDPLGPEMGDYRLASAPDGEQVAGLMPRSQDMGLPGWTLYFAADDVDALATRLQELGGTLHFGPHDIPGVGRFATVADPQGVVFHVMRGNVDAPSAAFRVMPGEAGIGHGVWIELATPDPDGAFDFYGALFGWTRAGAMPMGALGEYAFIGAGGAPCPAGVEAATGPGAIMSSAATGAPAAWSWYIRVPDIDAAVRVAQRAGGTLVQGPDQIPGGDYSANLTDDQGHAIGLVGPRSTGA